MLVKCNYISEGKWLAGMKPYKHDGDDGKNTQKYMLLYQQKAC